MMRDLRRSTLTNDDNAAARGVSDTAGAAAGLSHAFKRWTGKTPSALRAAK